MDKPHTVRSLTGRLLELSRLGLADTGFPLLAKEPISEDGRVFGVNRVMGFLGMNELEHALCRSHFDTRLLNNANTGRGGELIRDSDVGG